MSEGSEVRRLLPRDAPPRALVAHRVLETMDELVDRLGDAYLVVPEYEALGPDRMRDEVLVVSRQIVEGFLVPIVDDEQPDPGRVAVLGDMGRRRLEMGVPLEPMLHVYRIAGGVLWRALADAVEPGEEHVLGDLGAAWMSYIDEAASIAAAAYLDASTEQIRRVDAERQALLEALLAATTPAEVAAVSIRFSIVLAPRYSAVVAEGTEVSTGVDAVLDAASEGAIAGIRGGRLLLLLPDPPGDLGPVWRAAGRPHLAWAPPVAPGPELLEAVGRTEQLLVAARRAGVPTGIYGPDDLLVERLAAADPDVAAAFRRAVLDPLAAGDHDGVLASTLSTYLETGSVPRTAEAEYVHPNTVLYRLRRIHELTGFDPRVPAQAARLVLALGLEAQTVRPYDPPSDPESGGAP